MTDSLRFDAAGRLLDNTRELASVAAGDWPAFARVMIGSGVYAITRGRRKGWRFDMVDPRDGRVVLAFRPFLLRRGGVLTGIGDNLRLTASLARRRWKIATTAQHLEITVTVRPSTMRAARITGRQKRVTRPGVPPELMLDNHGTGAVSTEWIPIITFACWLIVQWELTSAIHQGYSFVPG
jgi:hypothetical protein